ncbi:histidinol-phosphatase [Labilibaculum sp.]|uniref:histidinol-phosphatase n=1 Tax=Labilibaculum sp. TaxID=2060723 RepID=UPI0035630D42
MNYFSYHTHSTFCDGKNSPEEMVVRAIELGLTAIGFSSHAPLPVKQSWSMPSEKLTNYVAEIKGLRKKFKAEIQIYLSLEIDYIPGLTNSFSEFTKVADLDYTIGSVHLVKADSDTEFWFLDGPDTNYIHGIEVLFDGDAKKAVTAYYEQLIEMVETQKPDVIAHADKVKMNSKGRFFSEKETWYLELVDRTIRAIKQNGSIVEINSRGIYKKKSTSFFPDHYFLEECQKNSIPVTISSDAHHVDELVAGFDLAEKRLKEFGFQSIRLFEEGHWIEHFL